MDIKKLSTQRLLTMYRDLRKCSFSRDPERAYDEQEEDEDNLLIEMKAELDTREHVVKKRR
jgi:hypothetical protein